MMLVVADASPVIILIKIECVDVLPRLFGAVRVPPEVVAELTKTTRPPEVLEYMMKSPPWLVEQAPSRLITLDNLDPGELAAISLAEEIHADLLLIDELKGRKAASNRNLSLTGTIGVLELAASRNMIDLATAFDRIKQTDFWISHNLLDHRLQLFRSRQGDK